MSFLAGSRILLAFVPVGFKKVEVYVLAGVGLENGLIEGHAQAGALRQREAAIHHFRHAAGGRFDVRLAEVVEVFLDLEVRGAGSQV